MSLRRSNSTSREIPIRMIRIQYWKKPLKMDMAPIIAQNRSIIRSPRPPVSASIAARMANGIAAPDGVLDQQRREPQREAAPVGPQIGTDEFDLGLHSENHSVTVLVAS